MTNGDKIRKLTDKELVRFLDDYGVILQFCPSEDVDCNGETNCKRCWIKWIQEEVQEDG